MKTQRKTSFTFSLSGDQQVLLGNILQKGNYRPLNVEHSLAAAETDECRIVLFKSGKCLVQGRGAEDFVMFVLEPVVMQRADLGYEETMAPEIYAPHMGVDESGKGDFFGPLVAASVFTDGSIAKSLLAMGVKDSKRILSDSKAVNLAKDIRERLEGRYSVVPIGPYAYNRLYAKLGNVNRILAWAHARAIENLLDIVPSCPRAVSDQFGHKEDVRRALMAKGRGIELVQRHRAETDVAVAAASILARAAFLSGLRKLESGFSVSLSKGASARVLEEGRNLVEKHGPESLLKTAKCHFRTTDEILKKASLDRRSLGAEGAATSRPRAKVKR